MDVIDHPFCDLSQSTEGAQWQRQSTGPVLRYCQLEMSKYGTMFFLI